MNHAPMPIGPGGRADRAAERAGRPRLQVHEVSEGGQGIHHVHDGQGELRPWEVASNGYVSPPLPAYNDNPVWTSDPKITPYRDCLKRCRDNGYAGDLGYASAAVMGDFVVVDMFAEAASGRRRRRRRRRAPPSAPSATTRSDQRTICAASGSPDAAIFLPRGIRHGSHAPSPLPRRSSAAASGAGHSRAGIVSARCSWCRRSRS